MTQDSPLKAALAEAKRALHAGDEAAHAAAIDRALEIQPAHVSARIHRARNLLRHGERDSARALMEAALADAPNDPPANIAYAELLLADGDYAAGWPHFERRFDMPRVLRRPLPDNARWDGRPLNGALVLVAEQGLGDTLHFARYGLRLRGRCREVLLDVQPPLRPLLRHSPWLGRVLQEGDKVQAQALAPMLSLPAILNDTPAQAAGSAPYVVAPPTADPPQALVGVDGLRVGVAWTGNRVHALNAFRSLAPDALRPLAANRGVNLFSLMAREAFQAAGSPEWMGDLSDATQGWEALAQVVAHLDLVITIDTAFAHLAGAMGRPVWLLLGRHPDWRWGWEGEATPWYPSMRVFRRGTQRSWADVIAEVAEALRVVAGGTGGADGAER